MPVDPLTQFWMPLVALLGVTFAYLTQRSASPLLAIVNRWTRWLVVAFFLSAFLQFSGWVSRPFWTLYLCALLGWFILETAWNWFAIDAVSKSHFPLFPPFRDNEHGEEWPAQRSFIRLRDWLRKGGYRRLQALVAEVADDVSLRMSVFENVNRNLRLQVLFIPTRTGSVTPCYSFQSQDAAGARLITDNYHLPYGGFYPEDWKIERRPLCRSITALAERHQARIDAHCFVPVPWERPPLQDLNFQQKVLERLNLDLGFLSPYDEREEHGRITREGRFRVWLELWTLKYLGLARSY